MASGIVMANVVSISALSVLANAPVGGGINGLAFSLLILFQDACRFCDANRTKIVAVCEQHAISRRRNATVIKVSHSPLTKSKSTLRRFHKQRFRIHKQRFHRCAAHLLQQERMRCAYGYMFRSGMSSGRLHVHSTSRIGTKI